jgi:regulator of cell morphogenesis and NO signaling
MKNISRFLLEDHRRIDEHFKAFQALALHDKAAAAQAFAEFVEGLKRHMMWEETLLFPLFERETGMVTFGPTGVMRAEHRQFRTMLQRLQDRLAQSEADDELDRELTRVMLAHNEKEETVLYPWIDDLLTDMEATIMVEQMKALSGEGRAS